MHKVYEEFQRDVLAIPTIPGEKTEAERFPGAEQTYTVEAMVQDRKAIQAGTSHFLGQNFSKSQNICFAGRDNTQQFAWTSSWGVSTRMIGALIMMHSDDDGLVCPPRVAPQQIVIIPVTPKEESRQAVLDHCEELARTLRAKTFHGQPLRVLEDRRDLGGGAKKWEWVKKGVPVRLEIGPRDLEKGSVCLQRRDRSSNEKSFGPGNGTARYRCGYSPKHPGHPASAGHCLPGLPYPPRLHSAGIGRKLLRRGRCRLAPGAVGRVSRRRRRTG